MKTFVLTLTVVNSDHLMVVKSAEVLGRAAAGLLLDGVGVNFHFAEAEVEDEDEGAAVGGTGD